MSNAHPLPPDVLLGRVGITAAGSVTSILIGGHLLGFAEIAGVIGSSIAIVAVLMVGAIGVMTAAGLPAVRRPSSLLTGPALGMLSFVVGVVPLTLGGFFGPLIGNDLSTLDTTRFTSYLGYLLALLGSWALLLAVIPTTAVIGFRLFHHTRKRRRKALKRTITKLCSRARAESWEKWIDHFAAPGYSAAFACSGLLAATVLTPLVGSLSIHFQQLLML